MLTVVTEEAVAILIVDRLACVASEVKLPIEDLAATGITDELKLLTDERVEGLFLNAAGCRTGE